jgi:hypothetical protein
MSNESQLKTLQVKDLIPDDWFANKEESTIFVRIYSSLGIPFDQFSNAFASIVSGSRAKGKVVFWPAVFGGLKYPDHKLFMCADKKGGPLLKVDVKTHEIPESSYVLFLTPKKVDGTDVIESEVASRLNICVGNLRAHFGLNLFRDLVLEAEFKAGENAFAAPSPPIRIPKPCEGPLLNTASWVQSVEISSILKEQGTDKIKRLKLAIEFLNEAMNRKDDFFHYWVALEIVCNGSAQSIRQKLKTCLKLKSLKDLEGIGFDRICTWRHDFFHNGIRPFLTSEVGTYIQKIFLDLLRQELNLEPKYYTLLLFGDPGVDLASLGISKKM